MTTNRPLTDAELSAQMLVVMGFDTSWRTTDQLLWVTAGRADREQMLRVLFALNDCGRISYKRNAGWRFARN